MTFYNAQNYGAALQAFALQTTIEKLGYKAEHVRFTDKLYSTPNLSTAKKIMAVYKLANGHIYKYLKTRKINQTTTKMFVDFRNNMLNTSREAYYSVKDLSEANTIYDCFVCGSDMIWSDIGQDRDAYFLSFADEYKRVSYAPSITGTKNYNSDQINYVKERLNGIKYLSAREQSGVEFIKAITGRDAFWAVDPTLLLNKEEWKTALNLKVNFVGKKYLLVYMFQGSECVNKQIHEFAKRHDLEIRYIPMTVSESFRNYKNGIESSYGPSEFVDMFMNASFVVTNSFHGLLFSLICNIPFALIHRGEENEWKDHEARMNSILDLVGLNDHYLYETDEFTDELLKIDYETVNGEIQEQRERSKNYLYNSIQEATSKRKDYCVPLKTVEDMEDKKCTGCGTCMYACPTNAISMEKNSEGFLYPKVFREKCILCGRCLNTCPSLKAHPEGKPLYSKCVVSSEDGQKNSASGGAFYSIAKYYLTELNGVVFGASFNEGCTECEHICIEKIEDIVKLQNSKYIQSDLKNTYKMAKEYLDDDRKVLFSGTPCQIAGLNAYLGKKYSNLLTIDLLCHGVPSPELWRKNVDEITKDNSKLVGCYFRSKENEEKTRSAFVIRYIFDDGAVIKRSYGDDVFYNLFINNASYRYSCYFCKYAKTERISDITIGDCDSWKTYENFMVGKAKSVLIVNTEFGDDVWKKVENRFDSITIDLEQEALVNTTLRIPSPKPIIREYVYEDLNRMSWKEFEHKYRVQRSFIGKIKYCVKLAINKCL